MPWLYDGLPDRPQWLRERVKRGSMRLLRESVAPKHFAYDNSKRSGDWTRVAQKRHRLRRRAYDVLTDPVVTFGVSLVGGPVAALQLDRLTDSDPGGSWPMLTFGTVLVVLSGWLSRTRSVVDQGQAAAWNDQVDRERLGALAEDIRSSVEDASTALGEDLAALRDEVRGLREGLN